MRGCAAHDPAQPAVCALCAPIVARRRARWRKAAVLGPLTAATVGGAAILLTRPTTAPPPPPAPPAEPIEALQRGRLATDPCDATTSMALVDHLIDDTRWRDAQTFATASIQRCGVIGRMKWRLAFADRELHDWADDARVTGELIAESPGDSDFWWWRGEALAYRGDPEGALADDRQSLALSLGAQAGQFAAARIALPAADAHQPCEAARADRYFVRELGGEPSQEMRDAMAAAARDPACVAEVGVGHPPTSGRAPGTVTGSTRGDAPVAATFTVDPSLGTTLLSRELAARAGLVVPEGPRGAATAGGALYSGVAMRVTLAVRGATARGVTVLVTDDLPGDAAGIIGLSYLWHFDR